MPTLSHSLDGSDPGALEEHLARFGVRVSATPLKGRRVVSSCGSSAAWPGLHLWEGTHAEGLRMTSEDPPDTLMAYAILSGGLEAEVGGGVSKAGPGDLLVSAPPETRALQFDAGTRTIGFSVRRDMLQGRLERLIDRPAGAALRFDAVVLPDAAACALVSVLLATARAAFCGELTAESAALAGLMRTLPDLVLECAPNTYSESIRSKPACLAPRQVRRAVAYIRDQPMPVLTTDELADICGVSVRSLQYAFREFVGMAPAEYWRKVRLERALEHIRRDPSESLSRIAAEWGFTNVTRFRELAGLS